MSTFNYCCTCYIHISGRGGWRAGGAAGDRLLFHHGQRDCGGNAFNVIGAKESNIAHIAERWTDGVHDDQD